MCGARLRGAGKLCRPLRWQQRGDEEVAGAQRDGKAEADQQVQECIVMVLEVLGRPQDLQQLRANRAWWDGAGGGWWRWWVVEVGGGGGRCLAEG